ncbi:MAG: DUF86 domain-containing protein [Planctomycetia bacterium]|nr:DUF86 domain-containing protein [Planctomycetia bacterium]
MSVPKDDRVYLWDMLTAARAVVDFTRGRSLAEYEADLLLRSAVERQIEIVGEAARRISKEFQEAHAEIPWRPIQAQRHVLAHDYGEIKHDRIWRVAETHVPELIVLLEPLVPAPPAEDQEPAE